MDDGGQLPHLSSPPPPPPQTCEIDLDRFEQRQDAINVSNKPQSVRQSVGQAGRQAGGKAGSRSLILARASIMNAAQMSASPLLSPLSLSLSLSRGIQRYSGKNSRWRVPRNRFPSTQPQTQRHRHPMGARKEASPLVPGSLVLLV